MPPWSTVKFCGRTERNSWTSRGQGQHFSVMMVTLPGARWITKVGDMDCIEGVLI